MELLNRYYSIDELESIASEFLPLLAKSSIFTFHGELGAGKTTLIAEICKLLNVQDTTGSPTFSLINEYEGSFDGRSIRIFHIDLYRLNDEEEARQAGIEDCLYGNGVSFVEWPSKVPSIIPNHAIEVHLVHLEDQRRNITISSAKND